MKNVPLSVLLVAVCASALIAALTASLLVTSSDGRDPAEGPRLAVTASVPIELRDELAGLREENRKLLERLVALERRPQPIQTAPFPTKEDAATREELAALAERVARWMPEVSRKKNAGRGDHPEEIEPSPAFTATVEKTLRAIRRRDSARGWRQGVRKAQHNLDDQLAKMRENLNLTSYQENELRTAFTANHERQLELIRLWEEGEASDEQLGEVKRTNHEQHQGALSTILTAEQLQQHHAAQGRGGKR